MLIYLNGAQNVAAHPNENYARELMELFTLGVDNYTENDVRESARAWTGWRVDRRPIASPSIRAARRRRKTFLGPDRTTSRRRHRRHHLRAAAVRAVLRHSLLNWFVYNDPEPELVDASRGAVCARHDFELAPVMSHAVSRSNVFYSARAYRALVKSPVEFVVGTYKTLGLSAVDAVALPALDTDGSATLLSRRTSRDGRAARTG